MKLAVTLLAIPMMAFATENVYQEHDHEPAHNIREKGDCDHKECKIVTQASVPEMGVWEANTLLALGVGGVWFFTRKRKVT